MSKLRTNKENLPIISCTSEITSPALGSRWSIDTDGKCFQKAGMGGICLNIGLGDKALGWEGDHVEPDVTVKFVGRQSAEDDMINYGLQFQACIGNDVYTCERNPKDRTKGMVIGKHGGVNHVMTCFGDKKDRLLPGQEILVWSWGQGLKLLDYPEIQIWNIDPDLLLKIPIKIKQDGSIEFPVTHCFPGSVMGSGLGDNEVYIGDCDITLTTEEEKEKAKELRIGDLVAIHNFDGRYGRHNRRDYVTIGVIIHGDSNISGHGPGLTTIASGQLRFLNFHIDLKANIINWTGFKSGKRRLK